MQFILFALSFGFKKDKDLIVNNIYIDLLNYSIWEVKVIVKKEKIIFFIIYIVLYVMVGYYRFKKIFICFII